MSSELNTNDALKTRASAGFNALLKIIVCKQTEPGVLSCHCLHASYFLLSVYAVLLFLCPVGSYICMENNFPHLVVGKNERQKQAGSSFAGGHQRLGDACG